MRKIKIDSIGQYIDYIYDFGLFNNYIFRGQGNKKYKLISSLKRNCGAKSDFLEKRLLENFKKYGLVAEGYNYKTIWENMIIAQHHGVPTRLLDFTSSPLVALHFALINNDLKDDAAIWAVDINRIHTDLIPKHYKSTLKKHNAYAFTVDMLKEMKLTIKKYNQDMEGKSLIFIEPPSADIRIINQKSMLAIIPNTLDPLDDFLDKRTIVYKFIIPHKKIVPFRTQLDYMNITERTMFPGLDGLSDYLKRRYYYNV